MQHSMLAAEELFEGQMSMGVIEQAYKLMESCRVCPRRCGINRLQDERGYCGVGKDAVVASLGPHFGEEDVLVGAGGSGTIFLAGCNLRCIFCQNYDISHRVVGQKVTPDELAGLALALERRGCHNINFVTPTHVAPIIMEAIHIARDRGLSVPIVYNCGGYESVEMLQLLEGSVEIYMPDTKFGDSQVAGKLANAPDYPEVIRCVLKEMHRQVGDLEIVDGLAVKGLLIRHLVLPNNYSGSKEAIDFIAQEVSSNSYVNVMAQYRPVFRAKEVPEINRYPTQEEFAAVCMYARARGLRLAR